MKDYMPKSYPKEEYPPAPDGHWKIGSYNVNGLKACYEKGFVEYVTAESPDGLHATRVYVINACHTCTCHQCREP